MASVCTLPRLLEEVARRRAGALAARGGSRGGARRPPQPGAPGSGSSTPGPLDFAEVWAVLDRYASICLELKKGIAVPGFCRIGWQASKLRGRTLYRPYFQLSETFCRSYGARTGAGGLHEGAEQSPIEELNFSKAAIRFSKTMTKDNVFVGLRAIVQQIGEVVSQGRPLSLQLSFGKIVAQERVVRLEFAPELYLAHGLDLPTEAELSPRQAPPAAEPTGMAAMGGFTLQGSAAPMPAGLRRTGGGALSSDADSHHYDSEYAPGSPSAAWRTPATGSDPSYSRPRMQPFEFELPEDGPAAATAHKATASAPARIKRQQYAHDDALHRQITELEVRASEAMRDLAELDGQAYRGNAMSERQHESRKVQMREHAAYLQRQIEAANVRRCAEAEQMSEPTVPMEQTRPRVPASYLAIARKRDMLTSQMREACAEELAALSVHSVGYDLPSPSSASRLPKPHNVLRQALDEQVEAKRQQQEALRQSERLLETTLLEAHSRQASQQKASEQAAKALEREVLKASWREESKLRDLKRSIEALEFGRRVPTSSAGAPPAPLPFPRSPARRPHSARHARGGSPPPLGPHSARGVSIGAAASLAISGARMVEAT